MYDYIKSKKCILAKRGKINYILDNNYNVLTCENFKEGILKLYNNKKLRYKIKSNITKYKIHSWKTISKKYLNTIKDLI